MAILHTKIDMSGHIVIGQTGDGTRQTVTHRYAAGEAGNKWRATFGLSL